MLNGYQQYKDLQVQTAASGELILLLYQGAIRFLNRARLAIEDREIEAAHNALIRSQDIILELNRALDKSAGPVATNLERLYDYMYRRLVYANVRKDVTAIDEVIAHLRELLSAWEQVIPSGQGGPPRSQFTPSAPSPAAAGSYRPISHAG